MKWLLSLYFSLTAPVFAEISEPVFFTLTPTITQYISADLKGLEGGADVVISKKVLKNFKLLQDVFPLHFVPHISLGGSFDYYSNLTIKSSGTIKLLYNGIYGLASKFTFKLDQKNYNKNTEQSLYYFMKFPVAYKDGLSVIYAGYTGKNIDYKHPYQQFLKLSGKHVNGFLGLNYNFNSAKNRLSKKHKISMNIEYHFTKKKIYLGFNLGL